MSLWARATSTHCVQNAGWLRSKLARQLAASLTSANSMLLFAQASASSELAAG